jgi:hypothetical protein
MCVLGSTWIRTCLIAIVLALGLSDVARAVPIAAISGPDNPFGSFPGLSIGSGRATQWQSSLAFDDVTVTADLSALPGLTGTVTAFLTNKVGPGTTAANEIAHATVNLPDFFAASHTVTLFTDLDLDPANYYLTIVGTGVWWTSDSSQVETTLFPCDNAIPCPVTIGAGDPAFPNWQMFTVQPNAYLPASVWTPFHFGFGEMHFSVDGTLRGDAPPTDPPPTVPEPGTLTLTVGGLVMVARKLRAQRAQTQASAAAR